MSDNGAVLAGFTKEIEADYRGETLYLLVKPETSLDSLFKAWDMDEQEFIVVRGWNCSITEKD